MRTLILAGALLLAGCMEAPVAKPAPAPVSASLAGSEWQVETLAGAPVGTARVTMAFTADRVAGSSGCNRYTGGWSGSGSGIKFGMMAGTRMACMDEALSRLEADFLKFLGDASSWRIDNGVLTVKTADGRALTARAATPAPR
ncbi:META domain-containing protein [Sandaracinobacteroides saxicola]|uniref:META domain-containing protein n=1 Tax=Sandaracinobacteroides saxicola TaxID=2759707 RepID=A0A7G5IGX8_9SPHN|nr:META domain-containing protein [Sandaracinobacteroides saxicola]QMW22620.1 META domain-containing protein [Sandaracinobacteroides saxicola]